MLIGNLWAVRSLFVSKTFLHFTFSREVRTANAATHLKDKMPHISGMLNRQLIGEDANIYS